MQRGQGELAPSMSSGISVQQRTTASQSCCCFMRAVTRWKQATASVLKSRCAGGIPRQQFAPREGRTIPAARNNKKAVALQRRLFIEL
jgi:hypothetical protein